MAPRRPEPIFVFVNPSSGGNKGQTFLQVPQPFIVKCDDGHEVDVRIFSLTEGESGKKRGFQLLREALASNGGAPIRLIVGGGDGTVMWADGEVEKHGVHSSQILYGIIPLGTGNDFSRVAGWGGKNPTNINDPGSDFAELRAMANRWAKAKPRPHDCWEVTIKVEDEFGEIKKVNSQKVEESLGSGVEESLGSGAAQGALKQKSFTMINYFSVGQESKVGIEFDKNRTKSQACNLFVYAWQGVVAELQCWSKQLINNLVDTLHAGTDINAPIVLDNDGDDDAVPRMIGDPESLMFLNVNSYAGGAAHLWQKDGKIGVKPAPKPAEINVEGNPGDGRIEVVTLPNIANIALDKIQHAARRVHSGGPYFLHFVQDAHEENDNDTYCQVDGEFFHLINPESARIVLKKKLQVLQNSDTIDEDSDDED